MKPFGMPFADTSNKSEMQGTALAKKTSTYRFVASSSTHHSTNDSRLGQQTGGRMFDREHTDLLASFGVGSILSWGSV